MSRYDQPSEPDLDRYEVRPVDDVDVPDFDEPDPPAQGEDFASELATHREFGSSWIATVEGRGSVRVTPVSETEVSLSAVVDPAEHAAHVLIEALGTLEQELTKTTDLARAHQLKQIIKRHFDQANRVDLKASAVIDTVMERRR